MPMDGFTLSFMTKSLCDNLVGGRVDKINQPERDVLLFMIRNNGSNHRLLISANASHSRIQFTSNVYENPSQPPMFCMLMRKHLMASRIISIKQLDGDRIVCIQFETHNELGDLVNKSLYAEIMGRHSNIVLVDEKGVIQDAIRHVRADMSRFRTVLPGGVYITPPKQDKINPANMDKHELYLLLKARNVSISKALQLSISGLAKYSTKELVQRLGLTGNELLEDEELIAVSDFVSNFYSTLFELEAPVVLYDDALVATDFFPFEYHSYSEQRQHRANSLSEAMDTYYLGRDLHQRISQRGASLQKLIKNIIERTEKKKAIMLENIAQEPIAERDRIYGELITANLHSIPKGAKIATVQNYYDEECPTIEIPLSTRISAAQNAQAYYKKYRKAKIARQYAESQLVNLEQDLLILENALSDLDKCTTTADLQEIRSVLTERNFIKPDSKGRKNKKIQSGKPYKFIAKDGTIIEVGKNAIQNDRLTLHARGNETWLHAQGIPGSHVIIRSENDPNDETLLLAAKLAVYYSKGRNHPQQAIDYTKRRYVKKPATGPAGFVTYTNFQTIITGVTNEEQSWIVSESSR